MSKARASAAPPADYDPKQFPPFANTVDVIILTVVDDVLKVLLIERDAAPYEGAWALPGGFVKPDESLEQTARRELREETGLKAAYLDQLHTYSDPGRDSRMRVVTTAFVAIVPLIGAIKAGTDARRAEMHDVQAALGPRPKLRLAFDHREILRGGVDYARQMLETTSVATSFVAREFSLSDLRRVYEAVWGVALDAGNFRRKVLGTQGFVTPTSRRSKPGPEGGKPADLYRAGGEAVLDPPLRRPADR